MISLADETATLAQAGRYAEALAHANESLATLRATHRGALKLYLSGDLGAGKTCFAQGFLQALGVTRAVRSPTYGLLELYPATELGSAGAIALEGVAHLDLYRLGEPDELEALGLADMDHAGWIWLVEWPERAVARLPQADLELRLTVPAQGRALEVIAHSELGHLWQHAVERGT